LLDATHGHDELEVRARALGISFNDPAFALVIPAEGESAPDPWRSVVRALGETRAPYLVLKSATEWLVLMQAGADQVYDFARSLGRLVGVGRSMSGMRAFRRSVADARFALARHRRGGDKNLAALFTSLPLAHWLIGTAPSDEFEDMCERVLAPLADHRQLLDAVVAYLSADQDILRAASSLHLHPNSLRYRLSKVESRIGSSLRRPETIMSLYTALAARGYV
jgi:DNA-binding PucR family transcriptional regulator